MPVAGALLALALTAGFGPEPLIAGAPYVLRGHREAITALACGPDGGVLASASREGEVRVWSLSDGGLEATLRGAEGQVEALAFSPDGRSLAVGEAFRVRVWVDGGVALSVVHPDVVNSVEVSPDGAALAVAGLRSGGAVYELSTGAPRFSFQGQVARFDRAGRRLLVVGSAGTLAWLDARTGAVQGSVRTAPYLPAGAWPWGGVVASWDGVEPSLRLVARESLRAADGGVLSTGRGDAVTTAVVDERLLLAATADGRTWGWRPGRPSPTVSWPTEHASAVALCPGWVAVGDGRVVKLWRRE